MARLDIKPTNRLHMLVWRSTWGKRWLVTLALNGSPLDFAQRFNTFEEALNAALERAGLR